MIFKKDINDILFCEFIIFILFFTFLSIIGIYVKKGDIMENTFDMKEKCNRSVIKNFDKEV